MSVDAKFWNDCYADGKTGWDRGNVHPFLLRLIADSILEPCKVIVPGCGRGYEVIEFAQRGFDVTGVDIADEPVQRLRKELNGYEANSRVLQTDVLNYLPTSPVDAVYEQTCLCAIDPSLRSQYEQTVYDWLAPDGELFVLFMQKAERPNEGPPFHCGLEEMRNLFPQTRWGWQDEKQALRFEHPSGKLFELGFVLRKLV